MKTYVYIIRTSNGLAQTKPTTNLMHLRKDVSKYLTLLSQHKKITQEERASVNQKAQSFIGEIIDRECEISKPAAPDTPHYKSHEYKLMKRREQLERQKKAKMEKENAS